MAEVDLMPVMMRRLTITGSTLRAQPSERKARIAAGLHRDFWPAFADGRVKVVVHKVFPLAEAGAAHALMESGTHVGKILLKL